MSPFSAGNQRKGAHSTSLEIQMQGMKATSDFLAYQMAKALKVSLNGTRIMDLPRIDRPDARPTNLMLKPVTREPHPKGTNTLMVESTPGGPGGQVALKRGQ